jgi:outer membrane protein assembly factor BamB
VSNEAVHSDDTKSDYYVEITPDGKVVWEWHTDEYALKLKNFVDVQFPRKDRDWAHTNTVEVLPDNALAKKDSRFRKGNVLFSMRNVDTIGVIDKETGEVVWAWGPGVLDKQHMPTMLENGNILVYDNGTARKYTRILEIAPATGEIVWEYRSDPPESFFSPTRGSNQRLPNGNTFIAESDSGRLFEVTPEGEIVWEFLNPDLTKAGKRMPLYRSIRYSPQFIEQLLNR